MQKSNQLPFTQQFWEHICKLAGKNRAPLLSGFIVGLVTHFYMLANKIPNHDDAGSLFSAGGALSIGRWGIDLLVRVLPPISMPWFNGMLSICLFCIAAVILTRILDIRNTPLACLLVGLVVSFPSLAGNMAYMFTIVYYGISFLFSVLAVWFFSRNKPLTRFASLPCLFFSLSIYQAYISFAATLLILLLMRRTLSGLEKTRKLIWDGVLSVLLLILAMGAYYAVTLLLQRAAGVSFASYATSALDFSVRNLIGDIRHAYHEFSCLFRYNFYSLIPTDTSRMVHIGCAIVVVPLLLLRELKNRNLPQTLLLGFLLFIFPLAVNCIFLLVSPGAVHTLVLYSVVLIYALAVLAIDSYTDVLPGMLYRLGYDFVSLALVFVLAVNVHFANKTYLGMHMRYETLYSLSTAMIARISSQQGFNAETRLCILGSNPEESADPTYLAQKFSNTIIGTSYPSSTMYSYPEFLRYYIGVQNPFVDSNTRSQIENSDALRTMPIYPSEGSVSMWDDNICVVRMSGS